MTAVLRMPLLQSLPPANLQKILISLKTSQYSPGEVIIAKGSEVDYFYIVQKGQCQLTRKYHDGEDELKLGAGDSFGEEYLITDRPAKETVTAITDVSLIQLEKKHFLTQIASPSISYISPESSQEATANGAVLLDVRLPEHFENHALAESANIPLLAIRMRLEEIPKDKQIIVVCENGKKSEAAAFLLVKNKCNAVVLKGGMGIEEEATDNTEDSGLSEEHQETYQSNQDTENATADNGDQLASLRSENARLAQQNRELEEKNATLQAEKERAETQCQNLTQQLERLKEILSRLTKRK
jgi:CRP-like cAMP-binding protein